MILSPRLPFFSEMSGIDLFLLLLIVLVLIMVVTVGPHRHSYIESVLSMYRFRSSEAEITSPSGSFFQGFINFIASCSSFGLMLCSIEGEFNIENGRGLMIFVIGVVFASLFYLLKLILYSSVNGLLFRKQVINVKPSRLRGFFIFSFTVMGVLFIIVTLIVTFFGLPRPYSLILLCVALVFLEIGIIYKIKTALFKNNESYMSFFYYLCALEFGPLALTIPALLRVLYLI